MSRRTGHMLVALALLASEVAVDGGAVGNFGACDGMARPPAHETAPENGSFSPATR